MNRPLGRFGVAATVYADAEDGVLDPVALGQSRGDHAGDFAAAEQHVVDPLDAWRLAKRVEPAKRIDYREGRQHAKAKAQLGRGAVR